MDDGVNLAGDDHAAEILLRRHLADGHAARRLEADRAAMAVARHALHPPLHVARRHAEFMLQGPARPERRGLLVLRHADALALEIGRLVDACIAPHDDLGMKHFARGEDRDADPALVARGHRHHQRRHRHLGDVEVAELELAPEELRGKHLARHELDAVGLHVAVEDRPRAGICRNANAELQLHAPIMTLGCVMPRYAHMLLICSLLAPAMLHADGGPLGIDHRWNYDNSGIWKRSNQDLLRYGALAADIGLALWEGDGSRLGRSAWQSVDSVVLAGITAEAAKLVFGRERPRDTNDPDQWFKSGNRSFPSGEVAEISAIITPYVLEYRHDHPAVWALELLPAYDAIARMKVQAHWQTDVLAGFALGTAAGVLAYQRNTPFILSVLPHSVSIGFKKRF